MSWENIRGRIGAGLFACVLLCLGAVAVPAAHAEATAEAMYQPSTVDVINLTLPKKSVEKLEADPEEEYVEGTFSLAETEGTPQTVGEFSAPLTVGIRLKGTGSFRTLAEKAAFKIKFSFVKHQKYLGLKKMTLNNMVQDPSMTHETLAYEAFRSAGVPGPHTGFAYLYVNGENFGLHLNIETVDQEFLEKRFGPFQEPPQHLYSGEDGTDVTVGGAGSFAVNEGEEENRSDLEALIEAVNASQPADFSERVESVAELREMTHEWAVEKYIGHWDGYAGEASRPNFPLPNNYYLYSSAAGVFQMLPWGTDQTWEERLSFDGQAGLMFDDCLEDESCAAMYRAALREVQIKVPALNLDSLASSTAALLEPWQALEASPRQPFNAQQIQEGVEGTLSFMAQRPAELHSWLTTQREPVLALQQTSISANGIATTTATATLTDGNGEPVSGDHVVFTSTDSGQQIGAVTDHGDGTYSAQITASRTAGTPTITATDSSVSPSVSATAALTQTPAASQVALALQPSSILADGSATTTATATVTDPEGSPMIGDDLSFSSTDPGVRIGTLTNNGDGTYSAQITASTSVGTPTITATDSSVSPAITATAVLRQTPGPASHVALTLQPNSILADGIATTTATATVTDAEGHPVIADHLAFTSTDSGQQIGPVTDHGDGTYSAQITASTDAGTATITATDRSLTPGLTATAALDQFVNIPPPGILSGPLVTITAGPPRRTRERRPSFHFASNQAGSTFQCKLGVQSYRPCSSPDMLTRLSLGAHVFQVQAANQAGTVGPAVAYRFVVDPQRRSRRGTARRGARAVITRETTRLVQ